MKRIVTAITKHDEELASRIWRAYKPTLQEKHGYSGSMGKEGEDAALTFLDDEQFFPEVKYAITHEDALHQLLGIDITAIHHDGSSDFIDVKFGASSLYFTKQKGWFITIKPTYLKTHKRNDSYLHIGPKRDVFVYYLRDNLRDYIQKEWSDESLMNNPLEKELILPRGAWNSIKDLKTNVW